MRVRDVVGVLICSGFEPTESKGGLWHWCSSYPSSGAVGAANLSDSAVVSFAPFPFGALGIILLWIAW